MAKALGMHAYGDIKLFAGSGCRELAQEISQYLSVPRLDDRGGVAARRRGVVQREDQLRPHDRLLRSRLTIRRHRNSPNAQCHQAKEESISSHRTFSSGPPIL